jgi:hypothetical protein
MGHMGVYGLERVVLIGMCNIEREGLIRIVVRV